MSKFEKKNKKNDIDMNDIIKYLSAICGRLDAIIKNQRDTSVVSGSLECTGAPIAETGTIKPWKPKKLKKHSKKIKLLQDRIDNLESDLADEIAKRQWLRNIFIAHSSAMELMIQKYCDNLGLPNTALKEMNDQLLKILEDLCSDDDRQVIEKINKVLGYTRWITNPEVDNDMLSGFNYSKMSSDRRSDSEGGYEFDVDELKETILAMDEERQKLKAILIDQGLIELADMIGKQVKFKD